MSSETSRAAASGSALPFSSSGVSGSTVTAPRSEAERFRAEQDLAGLCRLLEPGGDVDRIAGREPLLGAGDDLTGVDAEPDAQRRPVVALELGVQRLERIAQLHGGTHRPQRVVLVHLRHAEDRHHRIADELLHRAAVPLDDGLGCLEVARQHAAQALRVEPLAERSRSRDVAEEHGDGLPLLARCRGAGERRGALVAEPCSVGVLVTAVRADRHVQRLERCTTDDQRQAVPAAACADT